MSRKHLHFDAQAEHEANDIAYQFMDSHNVIRDMGKAYNTDFSPVKIHTDSSAAQRAESAGVDAFASGQGIFFGRGAFDQNDPASRGLLAHELAHTMQQGMGAGSMGVQASAPQGVPQGGILDWFRNMFKRKKKPEPELEIGGPRDLQPDQSGDAKKYRAALAPIRAADRAKVVQNIATPEAKIGTGGNDDTFTDFQNKLKGVNKEGTQVSQNYLEKSNQSARAGNQYDALVNLGIRNSTEAPSQAELSMRGDIYSSLSSNYADYMYNLQKGGLDSDSILNEETAVSDLINMGPDENGNDHIEKLAYATGAGYDSITDKTLDMFSEYILSDQSLDYIRKFMNGISPAEVFGGQKYGLKGASGFVLHTLSNTVGATVSNAAGDKRLSASTKRVSANVGRTMGSLPVMASMPEDKIPESLLPLRRRYIQLQEELDRRLKGEG